MGVAPGMFRGIPSYSMTYGSKTGSVSGKSGGFQKAQRSKSSLGGYRNKGQFIEKYAHGPMDKSYFKSQNSSLAEVDDDIDLEYEQVKNSELSKTALIDQQRSKSLMLSALFQQQKSTSVSKNIDPKRIKRGIALAEKLINEGKFAELESKLGVTYSSVKPQSKHGKTTNSKFQATHPSKKSIRTPSKRSSPSKSRSKESLHSHHEIDLVQGQKLDMKNKSQLEIESITYQKKRKQEFSKLIKISQPLMKDYSPQKFVINKAKTTTNKFANFNLDSRLTPLNRMNKYRHQTVTDMIGFRQRLDNQYQNIKNYTGPKIRSKNVTSKNVNLLSSNLLMEGDMFHSKRSRGTDMSAENYTDRLSMMKMSDQRKFKLRLVNKRVSNPNTKELKLNRKYRVSQRKNSKAGTYSNSFETQKKDFEHLQNRRIMNKSKPKYPFEAILTIQCSIQVDFLQDTDNIQTRTRLESNVRGSSCSNNLSKNMLSMPNSILH